MTEQNIKVKKKAMTISLVIGMLMFAGKTSAYLLTGSAAVLSDALESIVHIIATAFAFYSLLISLKPPSRKLPYGYGKVEFFSAGFEGALIIIAAFSIYYYAIMDLIKGPEIDSLDTGALIIAIASLTNLFLGLYLIRSGKKTNSLILIADGKHVLTDSVTSIGAFIALILVLITDIPYFDPIIAIILASQILYTGSHLIKESISGLMNQNDNKILSEIAEAFDKERSENENLIDIHNLRYWKSGEKFYVDFHLTLPFYLTVLNTHKYYQRLEDILKKIFKTDQVEVMIHVDPCKTIACKVCRKHDCVDRKSENVDCKIWDVDKITGKASYNL